MTERIVKIVNHALKLKDWPIVCPMQTVGWVSGEFTPCRNICAWFSISIDRDGVGKDGKEKWAEYANCKDHRIGKIKG